MFSDGFCHIKDFNLCPCDWKPAISTLQTSEGLNILLRFWAIKQNWSNSLNQQLLLLKVSSFLFQCFAFKCFIMEKKNTWPAKTYELYKWEQILIFFFFNSLKQMICSLKQEPQYITVIMQHSHHHTTKTFHVFGPCVVIECYFPLLSCLLLALVPR